MLLGHTFLRALLKTNSESHQLLISKKGKSSIISSKIENNLPSMNKKEKITLLSNNNKYLQMLGICDKNGRVKDKQQNKSNRLIDMLN